jgi:hypothetical protein
VPPALPCQAPARSLLLRSLAWQARRLRVHEGSVGREKLSRCTAGNPLARCSAVNTLQTGLPAPPLRSASTLAEFGTHQLEFWRLSETTGNATYAELAQGPIRHLHTHWPNQVLATRWPPSLIFFPCHARQVSCCATWGGSAATGLAAAAWLAEPRELPAPPCCLPRLDSITRPTPPAQPPHPS